MTEIAETIAEPSPDKKALSKKYTRTKLILSLLENGLTAGYFLFLIFLGGSFWLGRMAENLVPQTYGKLAIFILFMLAGNTILTIPVSFFSSFVVDHRYGLSNQNFVQWLWEKAKGLLIEGGIIIPLLLILYFCVQRWPSGWWLPVGMAFFFFSVILAKLAPVVIFPLFYKFSPIENEELTSRILTLCKQVGVRVRDILSFNLSKTTQKANAAFTGLGKTKRIIISDTLLEKFDLPEIEVVFAHELGHTFYGHIWKTLVLGLVSTFAGLFLAARAYSASLGYLGFSRVDQIEALPLLFFYLLLFGLVTAPLQNMVSRHYERQADRFALQMTKQVDAFIRAMTKLSDINLSDQKPNRVVEFLFYSHPSIEKRIASARKLARENGWAINV